MREIKLNGYIDEEIWFGDEFTPGTVHDALYGEKGDLQDDVHIVLNSYGGSVNAATQIHDEIKGYPGKVSITVSGTAASAAVGVALAADELMMTPGSMMMIHDPVCMAYGNEADMQNTIRLLQAAKASILDIYETRVKSPRDEVAQMMTDETWMDSKEALKHGFIDAVAQKTGGAENSTGERAYNREEAKAKIMAWHNRKAAAAMPKARDEPENNRSEKRVSAREYTLRLAMLAR